MENRLKLTSDLSSQTIVEGKSKRAFHWVAGEPTIEPSIDQIGRWCWPGSDDKVFLLLAKSSQERVVLNFWIEDLICALVPLEEDEETKLIEKFMDNDSRDSPDLIKNLACRSERISRFKGAAFSLHVDEHFSRTKRQRERIIYSMLRCKSKSLISELAIAIREGELDFAAAAIRYSEGPESAMGGRIGPISPEVGHPDVNAVLEKSNQGDLIGPIPIGDTNVLLRLDNRIATQLDEGMQAMLIDELYSEWLNRQLDALLKGESIEPIEYLPSP